MLLPTLPLFNISDCIVKSLKFLAATISRNLQCERNVVTIAKKALQRMLFLLQLKKFNLMIQF